MTKVITKAKSTSAAAYTDIPVQPSAYNVSYSDVSKSTAGRMADGTMMKDKTGTCAVVALAWSGLNGTNAQTILELFANEYLNVEYYDLKTASLQTKEFYVGDIKGGCLANGLWSVSFNIIQRTPS